MSKIDGTPPTPGMCPPMSPPEQPQQKPRHSSLNNALALMATMVAVGKGVPASAGELGNYPTDSSSGIGRIADDGALDMLGKQRAAGAAAVGAACVGVLAANRRRRQAAGAHRNEAGHGSAATTRAAEPPPASAASRKVIDPRAALEPRGGPSDESAEHEDRSRLATTAEALNLAHRQLNFRPYIDTPRRFADEVGRKCQVVRDALPIAQTPAAGVRAVLMSRTGANVVEAQIFEQRTVVAVIGPEADRLAAEMQPLLHDSVGDMPLTICAADTLASPTGARQQVAEALDLMIGLHRDPAKLASMAGMNDAPSLLAWRLRILGAIQ